MKGERGRKTMRGMKSVAGLEQFTTTVATNFCALALTPPTSRGPSGRDDLLGALF